MAIRIWNRKDGILALPEALGGGFVPAQGTRIVDGSAEQVLEILTGSPTGTLPRFMRLDTVDDALIAAAVQRQRAAIICTATTTGALAAYTRTGDVIQANANGAIAAQDGVTLVAGDVLFLRHGAAGADDGPYRMDQVGTAGTPFIEMV